MSIQWGKVIFTTEHWMPIQWGKMIFTIKYLIPIYTGGIPQRLDTAQRCDSENERSAVEAKTSAVLWQQWLGKCRDNDVHISVKVMAADSAVSCHYFHSNVHMLQH